MAMNMTLREPAQLVAEIDNQSVEAETPARRSAKTRVILKKAKAKGTAAKKSPRRNYDNVQYPEDRLPFFKFPAGSVRRGEGVDHWAPIRANDIGADALGAFYALLTVRAMSKKKGDGSAHQPLVDIIGAMVRKGRFFGGGKDPDWTAVSFISTIGDILAWADSAGIVDRYAMTMANRNCALVQKLDEAPGGRRFHADARKLLSRYATMYNIFTAEFEGISDEEAWTQLTKVGGRHD